MRIELHDGRIPTTPAMLEYVHQRISTALARFGEVVQRVRVVVSDIGSTRGGPDTLCAIHADVAWRGHSVIVAQNASENFYDAVAAAIKKLKKALRHMIDRAR